MSCELVDINTGQRFPNKQAAIDYQISQFFTNYKKFQDEIISAYGKVYQVYNNALNNFDFQADLIYNDVLKLREELFGLTESFELDSLEDLEKALPALFRKNGDLLVEDVLFNNIVELRQNKEAAAHAAKTDIDRLLVNPEFLAVDVEALTKLKKLFDLSRSILSMEQIVEYKNKINAVIDTAYSTHLTLKTYNNSIARLTDKGLTPTDFSLNTASISDIVNLIYFTQRKGLKAFAQQAQEVLRAKSLNSNTDLATVRKTLLDLKKSMVIASTLDPYPNVLEFPIEDITNFKESFYRLNRVQQDQVLQSMNDLNSTTEQLQAAAELLATEKLSTQDILNMIIVHSEIVECA